MKILYIGDVVGKAGVKVVEKVLPSLRAKYKIDLVIAQAENLSDGRGVKVADFKHLLSIGVDFCTGGNWSLNQDEIYPYLEDNNEPIIRPLNYPESTPGKGYKSLKTSDGEVLVISLLGQIVGKDANKQTANPLREIDRVISTSSLKDYRAIVVNFHGDYSSEKRVIGYYLDGRVSVVVGDHWHVPTADAMILPKGTAHITDVGMCGSLDSSLGVKLSSIIPRWQLGQKTRNVLEENGRMQFNAVLVEVNATNGLAKSVTQIQKIF